MNASLKEVIAHPQYPKLFSPLSLRKVTLRNRIVLLPMGGRMVRDGRPTEESIAFYRARAQAGVGLIITGASAVHPTSTLGNRGLSESFSNEALPNFSRLAEAVHSQGAAIFGQLFHAGRMIGGAAVWPSWAPSAVASPVAGDPQIPHEMTISEIEEIIEAFGTSAGNLRSCGFDGVEIHAAHGYLIAQFLSPHFNRREDRYGGSPEKRMRFLLDIVDVIRASIGPDHALGVRMSADEGLDEVDGITLPYSAHTAEILAASGKVDYISVAMGIRGAYVKDMSVPVGPAVAMAAAIRKSSGLPIIASQRINHPSFAESTLASGAADMIGMARAFVADWEWAAKAHDGRAEQIRPCIACIQVCRSETMGCVHSPTTGREIFWGPGSLQPTSAARKIVVVGGGPAGMETAVIAAERGHNVVLFESNSRLGGQVRIAAMAPNRTEVDGVVSYRAMQLERLGVQVRLGETANVEKIVAENPSAVVVATGALPAPPDVEGGELPHVIDIVRLLEPDSDTEKLLSSASSAVVVDDGSGFWETCSAVEALGKRGLQVHFVSPARQLGGNVPAEAIGPLLKRLRWHGVNLLPMHRVSSIEIGKVIVYDAVRLSATHILEEKELLADIVVYFSGKESVTGLVKQLLGKVPEVHMVGDCVSPRRINQAVYEGHRIGRSL